MPGPAILLEQAVYGSFAFWDRGYAVLARSPGVRDAWLAALLAACRRFGEAPHGVVAAPALFSLRIADGPRAVVGAFPQGLDDRGRPGAMAFHALLIADRDFRRAGGDPFAFAGCLRGEWTADTSALPPLPWRPEAAAPPGGDRDEDPRVGRIVVALVKGRRVALESDAPIDALARKVWSRLPDAARRRASVATWAFGNENRFDLVALPRLAGVPLDSSYLLPGAIDAFEPPRDAPGLSWSPSSRKVRAVAWAGAIGVALATGFLLGPPRSDLAPRREAEGRLDGPAEALAPADRARMLAGLAALAGRFHVPDPGDPAELMIRFAAQVRYRGPTLSPDELGRLAAEADPDRARALAWHDRIGLFLDGPPLPEDFRRLGLRRQVDAFVGSFRVRCAGVAEADRPAALADALSRDGPIVPTPLAARYPALSDYARFLMRLPRRNDAGRP